jgi:hypothetical protein
MIIGRETEVLGENLPQRYFVHHKSHFQDTGSNAGRRGGKPATNRLNHGAAFPIKVNSCIILNMCKIYEWVGF